MFLGGKNLPLLTAVGKIKVDRNPPAPSLHPDNARVAHPFPFVPRPVDSLSTYEEPKDR